MMNRLKVAALSVALPLASLTSAYGAVSLNFNLPDNTYEDYILNYYNGGADGHGAIGPNYGIVFGPDALSLLNYPLSNVSSEPDGGNSSMIFLSGSGDLMDVAAGFTTGFSFYYSAPYYTGSVTVYSGLDGTGSLLATLNLPETPAGSPANYSVWEPVGVSFAGTAESVNFSGTANYIAFADVTLGSVNPQIGNNVPDNTGASIYLLAALGLAGAAWASRKQGIAAI
ncbi:MAG: hypothetical protein ABSH38_13660 [Verrucomicrobiota bacterium]